MFSTRTMTIVAALCLSVGAGCSTPFLNSAVSSHAVVQDSGLAGEWIASGATTTRAIITEAPNGRYSVSMTVHHQGEFKTALNVDVALTNIGKDTYWDVFLARTERDKLVNTYGFLAVPVHQVMKVTRIGDELRVWNFDAAWLDSMAQREKVASNHVSLGGGEVSMVTATTDQVRDIILRHAHDPAAFEEPMIFRRMQK